MAASSPAWLALHLSPAALALLEREPTAADAVKLGPWAEPDVVARLKGRYPLLLHSLGVILSADEVVPPLGWPAAHALIEATGTPWLSEHLGFAAREVRIAWHAGAVTVTSAGPLAPPEIEARLIAHLGRLRAEVGLPVLAENLDYVPNPAYAHVTDPHLIRRVVIAADVGLLLDVAHARIAADWAGQPIRDYLAALPLDRALEWHVNGPRRREGRLWDAHATLTDDDLDLLAWLRPRCPALRAVTLEYWGDDLVTELAKLRAALGR